MIKIKVRARETMQFPGICVACAKPGASPLSLKKRRGRLTRIVDVPLCTDCAAEVRRQSGEEERFDRLGWIMAAGFGLMALALTLLLTPAGLSLWLRLMAGLLSGLGVATAVRTLFRHISASKALPAKKEILQAARLETFSWRAATFMFTNETFRERFREMNQALLMNPQNNEG